MSSQVSALLYEVRLVIFVFHSQRLVIFCLSFIGVRHCLSFTHRGKSYLSFTHKGQSSSSFTYRDESSFAFFTYRGKSSFVFHSQGYVIVYLSLIEASHIYLSLIKVSHLHLSLIEMSHFLPFSLIEASHLYLSVIIFKSSCVFHLQRLVILSFTHRGKSYLSFIHRLFQSLLCSVQILPAFFVLYLDSSALLCQVRFVFAVSSQVSLCCIKSGQCFIVSSQSGQFCFVK